MSKLNKIIIAIIVIFIIFGLVAIFTIKKPSSTITIQTPQGAVVVSDYTRHPAATTSYATIIEQNSEFQILNYKLDNSFLISLLSAPLGKARTDAENALLKDLNINQTQSCSLKTSVVVPQSIDITFSGKQLGMDFCPNSIALP